MDKNKKSVTQTVIEEHKKGSELKLNIHKEYMKNTSIVMKEEDSKEFENLLTALNINVKKI
ncbi:hypothetical protein [Lysinibacillus sp. K60]|uniref:hypothetical protein n=1 Tax=Lysinibacillus sp. K60 TaxID=2720027 RepID=UPI001C8C56E4|nr:hypothetical protein [Lysinibacillus sp. K60]MBX8946015.1 hypothetical protein [Lysinibacillus sp. K60]